MRDYRKVKFEDKSMENEEYRETVRGKCWDLKDSTFTYAQMSRESGVSYAAIRDFANCQDKKMHKDTWTKFSSYIDKTWMEYFRRGVWQQECQ